MADTNIDRNKFSASEILNQIAVDTDGDGKPDAIAVCNPDGTPILGGTESVQLSNDLVFIESNKGIIFTGTAPEAKQYKIVIDDNGDEPILKIVPL